MAKIRAIKAGRWRSWTILLRRDVAVALLEKIDTLIWKLDLESFGAGMDVGTHSLPIIPGKALSP